MQSMAPLESASTAAALPRWVSAETMMTGICRTRMISRRKSSPDLPGISTSSVSTSGEYRVIRFRASSAFAASPTTSIRGSERSRKRISPRMVAESSTMSTRTGFMRCPGRLHDTIRPSFTSPIHSFSRRLAERDENKFNVAASLPNARKRQVEAATYSRRMPGFPRFSLPGPR